MPVLATLLCIVCPQGEPATAPSPRSVASAFSSFDLDGDGTIELHQLRPLPWSESMPARTGDGVLVLVEERLLQGEDAQAAALQAALARHAADLTAEGFTALGFAARVQAGAVHQDGRTLLALRRFARAVARDLVPLAGIVLVGAFPEALLVRTCNWWRDDPVTLHAGKPDQRQWHQRWLRAHPEIVAHTADIVLGDLDGEWEGRYRLGPEQLRWNWCIPGDARADGTWPLLDADSGTFPLVDYFEVADGELAFETVTGDDGKESRVLRVLADRRDVECSAADRAHQNPMAVPDVFVSRINARGVAWVPRPELLDERGQPRAAPVPADVARPHWWHGLWRHDEACERRLLLSYFARNHAYRTGALRPPRRPASLAHALGSGFGAVQAARTEWPALDAALDVHGAPDLVAVAHWFAESAELRTLRAHSDPWGAAFARGDLAALERCIGGTPWAFTLDGRTARPSLASACGGGKLDFFLLRTLFENGITGGGASFYLHTGCEAISPPGATSLPWSDPAYGAFGGGAAVLFFADGLALIGRAKVFYDEPRGFAAALRAGLTFGAAWQRYFAIEAAAASWAEVGDDIGRKRAYFWSLLGDGSLRLQK